jgi:hypothetical protein
MALGVLGSTMTATAFPAQASVEAPYLICFNNRQSYASVARNMTLPGPPDGATVSVGAPVTFSAESSQALTFSVASSPALLSSPDIDSGAGLLQQGTSLYSFTSSKATATAGTIYWAASFTLTPNGCESPSTFMTPARTLIIVSPPTTEREEASKKQREEPNSPATARALTLTHLRQSHKTWSEKHVVNGSRAKHAVPVGTTFAFVLSKPANIKLTFTQLLPGARLGGKCLARRPHSKRDKCRRITPRGTLDAVAHAGANKIVFYGLLPHKHRLPAGKYKVAVVASTTTVHSAAQTLHFTIDRQPSDASRRRS